LKNETAYFIGIDGGGTRSRAVLADEHLNIKYSSGSGPLNPNIVGFSQSACTISDLIEKVRTGSTGIKISGVVVGSAGCGLAENAEKLKKEIIKLSSGSIDRKRIAVVGDNEICIEGAFEGGAGAVLIAGTGSIIFGRNRQGIVGRSGGLGRVLGDGGSGYSIGREGLKAVAEELDGSGKKTHLTPELSIRYGIDDRDELIRKVYGGNIDIPAIAAIVIKLAYGKDKICSGIIDRELEYYPVLVGSLMKKLKVRKLRLCLSGGLFTGNDFYRISASEKISGSIEGIEIVEPAFHPEIGAAMIAKKLFYRLK
jgi:N-acetylglucosamine kinase-like BadF-type ATPase